MTNHDHHQNETGPNRRIDVPLSVWPLQRPSDLVGRLVKQFTAPGETVTLLGVDGVLSVTDLGRDCTAYCDQTAIASEARAVASASETVGTGVVFCFEQEAFDLVEHLRVMPRPVLTICRDGAWDASVWWALTEAVSTWGLLAVLWDGSAVSATARSACAGSGLSYAGHIVAAETGEVDRAAQSAEGLADLEPGDPRRVHTNVGLWARYPSRIEGNGR
jgi:hypothetical protein